MNSPRSFLGVVIVLFASPVLCVFAAQPLGIYGVARDCEGKPIAGIDILLSAAKDPSLQRQIKSGPLGEYRFGDLAAGGYTITANLASCKPGAPIVVDLAASSDGIEADLTLVRGSTPPGDGKTPLSNPPLEFESSGIRGMIDQGGYSASSNGAAENLLTGIAQIKAQPNVGTSTVKDWPCSLEPELLKTAAEHPDQVETNRRAGDYYAAHDQPAKAIPFFKQALSIDPADYGATRGLAVSWLQSGDFENARKLLISFTQYHPSAEMHQLLARAYQGSGLFREAAAECRVANRAQPSEENLFGAGYEFILAGSLSDALAELQLGMERYPRSISIQIGASTAEFLQGKTSEALRSLLRAADIDPADPRPYPFIDSASSSSAERALQVQECFKRYLDRDPASAAANYYYAKSLLAQGVPDTVHVETLLKRAIQLDPSLASAHLQLADLYAQRNNDHDAIVEYQTAIRLAPERGEAHYRLARALKRAGKDDESAREMKVFLSQKWHIDADPKIHLDRLMSTIGQAESRSNPDVRCPAPSR
jgi:tetratricopeptide (TPR) repeat protein